MRSRALLATAVLGTALVSGGWLVERGLNVSRPTATDRSRMFEQVLQHVARDYVDTLPDSVIYQHAAAGLIDELHDPHSDYLSPALLKTLSERTSGRYPGIGASVDIRDGLVTIVSPTPGGPAATAGVQTGDRIVEVDGKSIRGVSIEEAQKLLRGAPNSVVRVTIDRPGVATPLRFALTRNEIKVRSVQHATLLDDGIGYLALTIFSEESAPDLRHTIDSLRAAGMKTLIFDLRGDPGGLLDQGVAVSELFLDPKETIVTMRGRTPETNRSYVDQHAQAWGTMPVIVLVDSLTASAAEIVSGALQDHDRAVLLGTTTYGKGSAQNVFPLLDGGAAKLTTALWYTPSGRSINRGRPSDTETLTDSDATRPRFHTDDGRVVLGGGGITPDVLLPSPMRTASDSAFDRMLGKQFQEFQDALTDVALEIKARRGVTSPDFTITPAMRADLMRRMRAKGIAVDTTVFHASAALVDRLLGYEVARYSFGPAAEYARRLRDDRAVTRAVELARGANTQRELLDRARMAAQ
jgi:carboxyl-terminal processing protease